MKESKIDNDEAVETYVKSDIIAFNKIYIARKLVNNPWQNG